MNNIKIDTLYTITHNRDEEPFIMENKTLQTMTEEEIPGIDRSIFKLVFTIDTFNVVRRLIKLGFKEVPHLILTNNLIYDLGRNRQLSFSNIGTPNEMLFLCELNKEDDRKIDELICLRNYDYDGYTTVEEIEQLINLLKCKKYC